MLLIYVLFQGSTQYNATRWIDVGPFNLQPSEFGRVTVALVLAMFFGENRRGARNPGDLAMAGAFAAVPFLLIARQPDLGTAVTLIPVCFGIAYLAGLRMKLIAILAIAAILHGAGRLEVRAQGLSENADHDVHQSGAGSTGRRLSAAAGADHRRIRRPDRQRVHEGHAGAVQVPARRPQRFHLLGARRGEGVSRRARGAGVVSVRDSEIVEAARLSKDRIGAYLVGGIISGFAFQVIYNITMSAGLAPVKGLTLPLMSYGGSSMIATLAGLASS